MIGKVIYSILSNNTAVAAIASNRIFPVLAAADAALPYVVYNQISRLPNANKDRTKQVETYRVQLDAYAATFDQASELADKINLALSFYNGTVSGIKVDIIVFENENDNLDNETEIYKKSHDYMIRIKN